jgi:signal transduction histidine kinase/ABC-type uncharacterized transport system substrate-binding protein
MKNKKINIVILSLLAITLIIGCFFIFVKSNTQRILVIHSYTKDLPSYTDNNKKIKDQFVRNGINPDIRTLYLDCERYSEKQEKQRMYKLICSALAGGWKPAVILASDDQAVYSLLSCNHPIIHKIPIVFGGVQYPNYKLLQKFSNVTGFVDKVDVMRNLDFIKRLMGNSIAIYTPIDYSFLGRKVNQDVAEQLRGQHVAGRYTYPDLTVDYVLELNEKYGYTIYDNFNIIDHYKHLKEDVRLIPQIRVFNRNFAKTKDGERFWFVNMQLDGVAHLIYKYDKFSELLTKISPCPVFTAANKNFGYNKNVVGGYMTSMYMESDDMVDAASRIIKGEDVSNIPITQSSKMYLVNWDAIKYFNINPGRLPESCVIVNRPFREKYPATWTAIIILSAAVILFIIGLYFYEVKKRHKMNITMRQQHNMLKSSLYAAKAFAWVLEDGYFTIDDSFWNIHGKKPQKISSAELQNMIAPEQRRLFTEAKDKMDKKSGGILQLQISFNDGEYSWWESRYFMSEKGNGAYYGLSFNIDETKNREKELEEMRKLAEKAEMKQSFLENINHEIRTPLNAITGFSQILATDNTLNDEEKEQYLKLVDTNNDKLLQIIDNILLISQLESSEITLSSTKVYTNLLIDSIYTKCKGLFPEKVQFIKEKANNIPCTIFVDEKYFTIAIQHLIENALKFTTEGYIKIGCVQKTTTNEVEIYVEDTGLGIDNDVRKLIFNQFYKQNRFAEGTGLGLTITRLIVEKLKGEINVKSEKGKGSRFFITLPCTYE